VGHTWLWATGSDHGLNIAGHAPQIDRQFKKQFALVNVGRQPADEFTILSLGRQLF